jgi:hypothetical protein
VRALDRRLLSLELFPFAPFIGASITSSFNSRRADSRGLEMQIKRDKENTTGHYRASEVAERNGRGASAGMSAGGRRAKDKSATDAAMDDRSSLDYDGA